MQQRTQFHEGICTDVDVETLAAFQQLINSSSLEDFSTNRFARIAVGSILKRTANSQSCMYQGKHQHGRENRRF